MYYSAYWYRGYGSEEGGEGGEGGGGGGEGSTQSQAASTGFQHGVIFGICNPQFIKSYVGFTTVPLKALHHQDGISSKWIFHVFNNKGENTGNHKNQTLFNLETPISST